MGSERIEYKAFDAGAHGLVERLSNDRFVAVGHLHDARSVPPGRTLRIGWLDHEPVSVVVVERDDLGLEVTLAVDPRHRRRGVGASGIDWARARARELGVRLHALVDTENRAARAFFVAHGFEAQPSMVEGHVRFVELA